MAMTLQQSQTAVHTLSGIDAVIGLWLIAAPFILDFTGDASATWNSVLFGAAAFLLAISREVGEGYRHAMPSWLNVVVGVWLIISPFILGFSALPAAMWSTIISGIALMVLATSDALATPRADRLT